MPTTVFTDYSKGVESVVDRVGGAPCIIKLPGGAKERALCSRIPRGPPLR